MKWYDENIKGEVDFFKEIKQKFPEKLIFEVRPKKRAAVEGVKGRENV